MTTIDSDWPLPSQSRQVRRLLYLAEGTSIGAGLSVVLLFITRLLFILYAAGFRFVATAGGGLLLFVLLVLLVRSTAFVKWARDPSAAPEYPLAYEDWQETRQWNLVAIVAFTSSGLWLGISVVTWGYKGTFFSWGLVLVSGIVVTGLVIYSYILYKIGFNVVFPGR